MENSGYVDSTYLDMTTQIVASAKQRTHELMSVEPGDRVLDVGCGPGSDTLPLADLVGDTGEVWGVDHDAEMVSEANSRAAAGGLDGCVHHRQADAAALPFDDAYFDACRSERVFQHLPDPSAGLAEMVRVTRPGGRIVVLESDYGSVSIDSALPEVERKVAEHLRSMVNSPWAGRSLRRLFSAAGLDDVAFEFLPLVFSELDVFSPTVRLERVLTEAASTGLITEDDARRFRADLEDADHAGGFLASAQFVLVSGTKPGPPAG